MCLVSKQKEPLIATKDIVCYKVVRIRLYNPEYWRGLYYDEEEFPFGKVEAKGPESVLVNSLLNNTYIGRGFFHASMALTDATLRYMEEEDRELNLRVVKCIIPKGNKYYMSMNSSEICSPSMIVYKDLDSYDKSMRCKYQAIIIYFKTIINKLLNIFK